MAGISGYDSNSISMLFSSLNSGSSNTASSGMLGINFTDYASIRSGSYFKLMKHYYSEVDSSSSKHPTTSTSTSKDKAATLAKVKNESEDVKKSADKLLAKGKDSLFEKKAATDKDGNTVYQYDTDKIYNKLNDFIGDYNNLIDATKDSNVSGILTNASSMVRMTKANESMLGKIGITIGSDNKLTLDQKVFEKANMENVKSMFHSTGSYGYQVSAQASMINYYAENEISKSNTYAKNGMYTYNYTTGEIYNSTT